MARSKIKDVKILKITYDAEINDIVFSVCTNNKGIFTEVIRGEDSRENAPLFLRTMGLYREWGYSIIDEED